jgi:hypothetical protein
MSNIFFLVDPFACTCWFRRKQRFETVLAQTVSVWFFYFVWFHDFHEIEDWLASKKTSLLPSEEEKGE